MRGVVYVYQCCWCLWLWPASNQDMLILAWEEGYRHHLLLVLPVLVLVHLTAVHWHTVQSSPSYIKPTNMIKHNAAGVTDTLHLGNDWSVKTDRRIPAKPINLVSMQIINKETQVDQVELRSNFIK